MKNLNAKIGKFLFALTIIVVLLKDKIDMGELQVGSCILLMIFGLCLMLVGFVLDDLNKERKIRDEEKRRQEWIRSLYRK